MCSVVATCQPQAALSNLAPGKRARDFFKKPQTAACLQGLLSMYGNSSTTSMGVWERGWQPAAAGDSLIHDGSGSIRSETRAGAHERETHTSSSQKQNYEAKVAMVQYLHADPVRIRLVGRRYGSTGRRVLPTILSCFPKHSQWIRGVQLRKKA